MHLLAMTLIMHLCYNFLEGWFLPFLTFHSQILLNIMITSIFDMKLLLNTRKNFFSIYFLNKNDHMSALVKYDYLSIKFNK